MDNNIVDRRKEDSDGDSFITDIQICLTDEDNIEAFLIGCNVKGEPTDETVTEVSEIDIFEPDIKAECERANKEYENNIDQVATLSFQQKRRSKRQNRLTPPKKLKRNRKPNTRLKNKEPQECKICLKKFSFPANLKRHYYFHSGEKPFECNICTRKFLSLSNLNEHVAIHSDKKPFKCEICKKKFGVKSYLKRHNKLVHSESKPFECNSCPKIFKQSYSLMVHKRSHSVNFERNKLSVREKLFECDVPDCKKKFTCASGLKRHKRIHGGEKRFECNICMKKFFTMQHIKRHELIHNGKKTIECNICLKKFARKTDLNIHKRIHSGKEPIECNICMKIFFIPYFLKRHEKIHK